MIEFRELIKKRVDRLFIIVWPPLGEEKQSDIDMSFGFVFNNEPDKLYIISTNRDDMWTPYVFFESLPQKEYAWGDFYIRMKMWMKMKDNDSILNTEYYDITESVLFAKIVHSKIIGLQLIHIENNSEPFGVKILFENEYIVSTPISDGNTIETSQFNQNNNIKVFENIGKIIYEEIR